VEGVSAAFKFIQKLWRLNNEILNKKNSPPKTEDATLQKIVNKTIYSVTKNLENFQYNVVIANIHEIYNLLNDHVINNKTSNKTLKNEWEKIIMLLIPLVPHLAHECSEKINKKLYWPEYDSRLLEEKNCTIVIQVDGRKRGTLQMPINSKEETIIKKSKEIDNVLKHIENTTIIKNIYLKNKLVNLITKK
jgi:leucyl-tRNA synthetase